MFALGFGLGAMAMFGVLVLIMVYGSGPDSSSTSPAADLPDSPDLMAEHREYQARLNAYMGLPRVDILDPDYGLTEDTDEH